MKRLALLTLAVVIAPFGLSAATIAVEGGGPYDVSTETLFTGIVTSSADGAGSYVIDFFTSGPAVTAVVDAAVTDATINTSFTDLTMSWIDGLNLNTIVSATGVDTLTSVFDTGFPVQQLVFAWTDSVNGSGFRFDVATTPVPLPASVLLLGAAFAGLGVVTRARRSGAASAA